MPTESVSRSVAVLGRATLPNTAATFSTALLSPATNSTSNRCSSVSAPTGNRHAAALHADHLHLAGEILVAELLERLAVHALVR